MTGRVGYPAPGMSSALPSENPGPRGFAEFFDSGAIAADLEEIALAHSGREREIRAAVAQHLNVVHANGRAAAERLLLADRHGRLCAERLCFMQDEIIRILFELATR